MYTHRITWKEEHLYLGTLTKTFRTTQDALRKHLKSLAKDILVHSIEVVKL